jgi:dTDP-4-amino-4,6-dideoxygalactose transaminase
MIPCANPLAQYLSRRQQILDAVTRVLDSGHYILGPEVEAFETAFAAYCGVEHAIGVASGTDALMLALRGLGIGPGDEVITVSHTAVATVAAVLAAGATPVLVDVEPDYWTIDPEAARRAITARTRAIIPVHLYGQPADMAAIMAIAGEHGLSVIEDCAQAVGAQYRGLRVGSVGDAGCFSFYPTKNLGAIGDGGAVVTKRTDVAARVRRLRQYGWDEHRATEAPGVNSRLDALQAAILGVKLPRLEADNARRREIAARYTEGLAGLPIDSPRARPHTSHVYHLYVIACEERDRLKQRLADADVVAGVHYPVPAHAHPGYDGKCRIGPGGLGLTDRLVGRILSLPMYPEMSAADVERVLSVMNGD